MQWNGFHIDWWWVVICVVIGVVAAAFDFEGRVLRRRLLLAILMLWSAVALGYNAVVGVIPTLPGLRWSEGMAALFRMVQGGIGLWAAYLGASTLRRWWQIGDKPDNE